MIECNQTDPRAVSQARPLCSSYFLAIHESLTVQVKDGNGLRYVVVRWALGVLADGSYEVIGVWVTPEAGSWTWQDVVDELEARGVEKVGLVSARGLALSFAIPRGRLRSVRASLEAMSQMQRNACRTIKRCGPCSDTGDVVPFVEEVLRCAELRIDTAEISAELDVEEVVRAGPRRKRSNALQTVASGV